MWAALSTIITWSNFDTQGALLFFILIFLHQIAVPHLIEPYK